MNYKNFAAVAANTGQQTANFLTDQTIRQMVCKAHAELAALKRTAIMQLDQKTQLNRAQRRAQKYHKKSRKGEVKIIPLPNMLDEFVVFDTPQRVIEQLKNGSIDASDDIPVFRDNTGQLCQVCPALDGWLYAWRMIISKLNANINLNPLMAINSRLHDNLPINLDMVNSAETVLTQCRHLYRSAPRDQVKQIAKIAQVHIKYGNDQ